MTSIICTIFQLFEKFQILVLNSKTVFNGKKPFVVMNRAPIDFGNIESNRSVIGFRSVNLIEFTDISVSVNYRSVSVNSVSVSVFLFTEPIYRLYN